MIINDFYESYVITKNYESRKKFSFLLELNEKTNEGGRIATDFVRLFNLQRKNYFLKRQYCSTDLSKISHKFPDKSRFLELLSVKPSPKRLNF